MLNTDIRSIGKNIEEYVVNIDKIRIELDIDETGIDYIDCPILTERRNTEDVYIFSISQVIILYIKRSDITKMSM